MRMGSRPGDGDSLWGRHLPTPPSIPRVVIQTSFLSSLSSRARGSQRMISDLETRGKKPAQHPQQQGNKEQVGSKQVREER